MAIIFKAGQVAVSDPSPNGPNAISNIKDVVVKVVKLTSANFSTTAINTLVAVLPADSTILSFRVWNKTKLDGNSISAATIAIGSASAGTQFAATFDVFTTVGTEATVSPVTGIMQNYSLPLGADIPIWVSGAATTGIPTAGELYLSIYYVR